MPTSTNMPVAIGTTVSHRRACDRSALALESVAAMDVNVSFSFLSLDAQLIRGWMAMVMVMIRPPPLRNARVQTEIPEILRPVERSKIQQLYIFFSELQRAVIGNGRPSFAYFY